jgi:phosphoglycerate kinase
MRFQKLGELDVANRRVFVRVDFNVPLDERGAISEDTRIRAAVPTVQDLVKRGAKVVLASHLGRPKKGPEEGLRLAPCAKRLSELLGKPVLALRECIGPEVSKALAALKAGDVVLLENVRFHPEEEKGDAAFAAQLANGAERYVNDAFGTAHRAHASVTGVAALLPPKARAAGLLMEKEIAALDRLLANVQKPFVAVLGGAKVSDKIKVVDQLLDRVDALLIGGGMAYTFLAAQGRKIGASKLEKERLDVAKAALAKAAARQVRLLLPVDHVAAASFSEDAKAERIDGVDIPDGRLGLDVGPKTIAAFQKEIAGAKTVVWNGPLGAFEHAPFDAGTVAVAREAARLTKSGALVSVAGGGDTVAALAQASVEDALTYVSAAGGAFLEWLEGKTLPGVAALAV